MFTLLIMAGVVMLMEITSPMQTGVFSRRLIITYHMSYHVVWLHVIDNDASWCQNRILYVKILGKLYFK